MKTIHHPQKQTTPKKCKLKKYNFTSIQHKITLIHKRILLLLNLCNTMFL